MKKTLFISLIAGLFLAFTACGPDEEEKAPPSEVTDDPQTVESSSHTIYSQIQYPITVKSGDASETAQAAGDCVEVPESRLADLVVTVAWGDDAVEQVLCGGEGEGAVDCEAKHVKVTRKSDGSGAEFSDSNLTGGCTPVLGEKAEEAAAAEGAAGGACRADEANKCDDGLTCNAENKCEAEAADAS